MWGRKQVAVEDGYENVSGADIRVVYSGKERLLALRLWDAMQSGDKVRQESLIHESRQRIGRRDALLVKKRIRPIYSEPQAWAAARAFAAIERGDIDGANAEFAAGLIDVEDMTLLHRLGLLAPYYNAAVSLRAEHDHATVAASDDAVASTTHAGPAAPGPLPTSPVAAGRERSAATPVVRLPVGTDTTDPHLRARVEQRVKAAYGDSWIPLWPLEPDLVDGVEAQIPLLDSRPSAIEIDLGSAAADSSAAKVAAVGSEQGAGDLVAYEPARRRAVFAHLPAATRQVRKAVAKELGAKNDWDIEIVVTSEIVVVLRSPALSGEEKRVERWTGLARKILPSRAGHKWFVEDDTFTGRIYLRLVEDRLREVQAYPWASVADLHHLPFGVREDGSTLTLGLLEVNMLLGGIPGGGKSGGLTALLCGIASLPHVALVGLDPKRVEQKPWSARFSRIAKEEDSATDVLERLRDEMERRYEYLEGAGLKKFGPSQFSDEKPLLVLVIDELADLVAVGVTPDDKKAEVERSTLIRRLIAKGRAAGIVVIAATQKPQSDVIPTALRDLIQLRVAYATTNSDMTDTILGKGMALNGGEAQTISASERGVCFVVNESSRTPVRARTYWVPDEDVEGVAQRYAHLRIDLPWLADDVAPAPPPVQPTVIDLGTFSLNDLGLDLSNDDFEEAPAPGPPLVSPSIWDE